MLSRKPMNSLEANDVLNRYSSLKGSSTLKGDIIRKVERLAIAPYELLDKWRFFNAYMETRSVDALSSTPSVDQFDVIVFLIDMRADGHVEYGYQALADFLEDRSEGIQPINRTETRRQLKKQVFDRPLNSRYWNSLA